MDPESKKNFLDWLRHPFSGVGFVHWSFRRRTEPYLDEELRALLGELNRHGAPRGLVAWPRVQLDQIVYSAAWGGKRTQELREIAGLVVDAGVFNAATGEVIFLIEVTSPGFTRGKKLREKRLRRTLEAAEIPLARWSAEWKPSPRRVESFLDEWAKEGVDVAAPLCPRCGGSMVKRLARQGTSGEAPFWGCANYPECRGTRNW